MRRKRTITFKAIFTLVIIFSGALSVTLYSAMIGDANTKLGNKRIQLQSQREDNAALRAESTQRYTLDEVDRLARDRLDMNKPDPSQIFYINVPKQSYVVMSDSVSQAETVARPLPLVWDWLDRIKQFFFGN